MQQDEPNQMVLFADTGAAERENKRQVELRQRATKLADRIVRRITRDLQAMRGPEMLLFGEETGLRNVWDEICIQQQGDESEGWGAYEATIQVKIEGALKDLTYAQCLELWRLTDAAIESEIENPNEENPPYDKTAVIEFIQAELIGKAINHSNARIRRFLERQYD